MKVKHTFMNKEKNSFRYILSPRERVLAFLKMYKEATLFQLSKGCKIQYDICRNIVKTLETEGKVVIIIHTGYDINGFEKIISYLIKYKDEIEDKK